MRKFKDLSKEEQVKILDQLMADDAQDLMTGGEYYQSLSAKDKQDINNIKTQGSLCGCYACVQSLLNNMKSFNLPIREGMIGRAMQKAESTTYP